MIDLEYAKALLRENNYTCVICRGQALYTSQARGVKPLATWYAGGMDFSGFSAADKVVGKATAWLYVLLDVKAVWAGVISRSALAVLEENGITARYECLVEHIINRKGDGICPFEEAVMGVERKEDVFPAIRRKMEQMNIPL